MGRQQFLKLSKEKVWDQKHRNTIAFNIGKYNAAVLSGKKQFVDLPKVREHAKNIKWEAIERLDHYLEIFERQFEHNGGTVLWAQDGKDALNYILDICQKHKVKKVVKSKSMVTEEIKLNSFLETHGIESIETDLGEYIQQLDEEPPYHIVTPAMHKSRQDIADLFHEKLDVAPDLSAEEMTKIARDKLRNKFIEADLGITGANFIAAKEGKIVITENEGNARLTTSLPKIHIAIIGIEKVIPSIQDLPLFLPLLSTFGTGQKITVYNTILGGPKSLKENDGPEKMYVILLDNQRTSLLASDMRESLYCIRCGSCLNACPVYKNIGGHSYEATYSGPIGAVITPHLKGMYDYGHLSFASSLCGQCTQECPINIQIHDLLVKNRQKYVNLGYESWSEKMTWKMYKSVMKHPFVISFPTAAIKNVLFKKLVLNSWGTHREILTFPPQSFYKLHKNYKKEKLQNLDHK